jgi:hypothetical protein
MKAARQIIIASLMLGTPITNAHATGFCFNVPGYIDVFTINGDNNGVVSGLDTAFINRFNQGYSIPLVGGATQAANAPTPGIEFFGLHGVVNTSTPAFGGHPDCVFSFVIPHSSHID